MRHRRMDISRAHRLDAPERMLWLPPSEVVDALALRPGEVIADVGAGTGYFSIPMARAVLPGGRVYAIDVQREMLSLLKKNLASILSPTWNSCMLTRVLPNCPMPRSMLCSWQTSGTSLNLAPPSCGSREESSSRRDASPFSTGGRMSSPNMGRHLTIGSAHRKQRPN